MTKVKVLVTGKRIGHGFAVSRLGLLDALSQTDAVAVRVGDCLVGRSGLIQYLRYARGAGSTVKIVPNNSHLRVDHGGMGSVTLPMWRWISPNKRTEAQVDAVYVEVVPHKEHYFDNIGAREFAQALERALVVTAPAKVHGDRAETRMIVWGDGQCLRVMSTDFTRLGEFVVPCAVTGQAFLAADEARTIIKALKKAPRARVEFREVEKEIWTDGERVKATATYLVVRAACLKIETYPQTGLPHVLKDGIPLSVLPDDPVATAYLAARETAELLRAAGLVTLDPEAKVKQQVVRVRVLPGRVNFSTNDRDVGLDMSIEADTEGEGEVYLDALKVLPLLRSMGNETFELGIREPMKPVSLSGDGFFYLVMPVVARAEEAQKPDAIPEEEPEKASEAA